MLRKLLITVLLLVIVKKVENQGTGAYGQTGDSQIGINSGANGNLNTGTNTYSPNTSPINTTPPNTTPNYTPSNTLPSYTSPQTNNTQNFGQNGNSQLGTSSQTNNFNPYDPTNTGISSDCKEIYSTSICISKPTCCHVTNSYSGYTFSACIDAKSSNNFDRFCDTFILLNNKEGFTTNECICNNYQYQIHANYLKSYITYITLFFVLFLMI
jgi:hypothetical protein